jgi:putative heme-binding domain-containing protein
MRRVRACLLLFATALASRTVLAQQQTSVLSETEDGRQLFLANCAVCHGPDGDSVYGVDLGRGKFKTASSDDDLIRILNVGVPGTSMPAFSKEFSQIEMRAVVSYLRFMKSTSGATFAPGDAIQGKVIFEGQGECLSCHRVRDRGSRVGPNLTEIGSLRRTVELRRSLLDPDTEVLPSSRFIRVVTEDGLTIIGKLLNQDTFSVQLIDSKERLQSFKRANLKEYGFMDKSLMPSYRDKLNSQQLADVVSYLASLKGIGVQ